MTHSAWRRYATGIRGLHLGGLVRVCVVSLFVATTAMIVAVAIPNIAAATQTDWSAPLNVDGSRRLTSVSCASSQFCVAATTRARGAYLQRLVVVGTQPYLTEGELRSCRARHHVLCLRRRWGCEKKPGTARRGTDRPRRVR